MATDTANSKSSKSAAARRYGFWASAQSWLQGHPNKHRSWALIALGNLISDCRYWTWRLTGEKP